MHPVFAFGMPSGTDLIIIAAVVLVLFGAERLPKLARSMGQAKREFEAGHLRQDAPAQPAPPQVPPEPPVPQAMPAPPQPPAGPQTPAGP